MKSLRSIVCEGLLDPDFEEQVDRQVMPKLAEYIISAWSKIHFKLGSTHEYDKCWVNAGDFESTKRAVEAFIFDFRLNGASKHKITRKLAKEKLYGYENCVLICFTGSMPNQESYFGISCPSKGEALLINKNAYGPMSASWNNQQSMVGIKDPSLWAAYRKQDIFSTLYPGWSNNGTKQRFYELPAWCWEPIKKAILS